MRGSNYRGRRKRRALPFIIAIIAAVALAFGAFAAFTHFTSPKTELPIASGGTTETPKAPEKQPDPTPEKQPDKKELPKEWADGGIFSAKYDKAYSLLQTMTTEEKVGSLLLARAPKESAVADVSKYHLGGYVLFGADFKGKTKSEVLSSIDAYQKAAKIPLVIATDEEGGSVVRVSSNKNLSKKEFNSPRYIYANGGLSALKKNTKEKTLLLSSLGINLNLAPVSDVSTSSKDYIYKRSMGKDAKTTATCIKTIVENMAGSGVSATLKHFPGYGNNVDTHSAVAVDKRPKSTFQNSDFLPIKAGIDAGAQCVLVSHNIVECFDKALPSSLSPKVHEVLTEDLGFTGIILTDDLAMDAIANESYGNPYVLAVKAGNHMLTTTNFEKCYDSLIAALKSGDLTESEIDAAAFKVLAFKLSQGIIK